MVTGAFYSKKQAIHIAKKQSISISRAIHHEETKSPILTKKV
jgi:hypothetical protein